MPKQLEKCVTALKEKGHNENSAFAICQSNDEEISISFDFQTTDNKFTTQIDEETGFLKVSGVIARTGIQQYLGMELPKSFNLDAFKIYNVFRPAGEVLKKESLDSYTNATITDNHPSEFVTVDNISDLGKGTISTVTTFKSGAIDFVKTDMMVTCKETIKKIQDGKIEWSPGYTTSYIKQNGIFDGESYDFIQTDILINHIALVDRGRCKGACKITDNQNDIILDDIQKVRSQNMAKVKVGDTEFEVCDAVAGEVASMQKQIKSLDADIEKREEEKEVMIKEKEELDAENGKMAGENENLKKELEEEKENTGDVAIAKRVNDRVALLKKASVQIGDTDVSKMTDREIKVLAIGKTSDMDLKGKSDEYVAGMFDTMVAGKANASLDALGNSIVTGDNKVSARDTYLAKLTGGNK